MRKAVLNAKAGWTDKFEIVDKNLLFFILRMTTITLIAL